MSGGPDTTGVLILRAWQEHASSLRIRLTRVTDVLEGTEPDTTVVSSVEDAVAIVRDFLTQLT